jgi:hypothetical protein
MPTSVAVLLAIATVFLVAGLFGIWVQRQALDTNRWVTTSARLLENQEIRSALSGYIADRLVAGEGDSGSRLGKLLSDRFSDADRSGLAEPVVRRAVAEALGTAPALAAWQQANRAAHRVLVRLVEGDLAPGGEVTLDLGALMSRVGDHVPLRGLVAEDRAANDARIVVVRVDELKRVQDIALGVRSLTWLLLAASVVLMVLAVHLWGDRRRGVMAAAGCVVLAGLGLLALRELAGEVVVGDLARTPDAEAAGAAAWSIATSLLVQLAVAVMVLGALVVAGGWFLGRRSRAGSAGHPSQP